MIRTSVDQGNFLVARDNVGVVYLAVGGPDAFDPVTTKNMEQLRSANDVSKTEFAFIDRVANIPMEQIFEALDPR